MCSSDLYIVSQPSTMKNRNLLAYVGYVEKEKFDAYPNDRFVHADIPLLVLSQFLTLTVARSIAASHGIATGSRCSTSQLKSFVEQHECVSCPSYITVFSAVDDSATKHAIRNRKYRKNLKTAECASTTSERLIEAEFPPQPSSIQLEHTIIKDVCKRMDPVNFEEVGCAVCGELRQRAKTSRLKAVKNFLSILEAPGVTRIERKKDTGTIKEFKGPVLDYSCSAVCDGCRSDLR